MGFNHCYLTSVEQLQKEFELKGLEQFVNSYRRYDALTGPSECFKFLEDKIKEYELCVHIINSGGGQPVE